MRMVDLIEKKKTGAPLSAAEMSFIIDGYVAGSIPDYQMSAFMMAICFRPLSYEETLALTLAMRDSGVVNDLTDLGAFTVDKHSTGGVGDKTTLVVGPLCAVLGLTMAKMSGRGLGHTGGTLDKLESIPGFSVDLSPAAFHQAARSCGLAVVGQSANLDPADKAMYALRDVTATIASPGLISSSIMSKKLASGTRHILLDVKVGSGAFMKTVADARALAKIMVRIGRDAGIPTRAVLTDMDQPLGEAIGNSLEVREAIATLNGEGPAVLEEETVAEAAILAEMAGKGDRADLANEARKALHDGRARSVFASFVTAQGGDARVVTEPSRLSVAPDVIDITAEEDGFIARADALALGEASFVLGAGRTTKDEAIDHAVGVIVKKRVGDRVAKGDLLARLHVHEKGRAEAVMLARQAFLISADACPARPLSLGVITEKEIDE